MSDTITIASDWTGAPLSPDAVATVELDWRSDALRLTVDAPFEDDPAPSGEPRCLDGLWEYEVVELFLVSERSLETSPHYLEIELSPHGHHLLLSFAGIRQRTGRHEPRSFRSRITGTRWRGEAVVDRALVPEGPLRANAFRIHGLGTARRYLAATAVPGKVPDFHRVDRYELAVVSGEAESRYRTRRTPAPYRRWGNDIDERSIEQIENACQLPISVRGALMPDAHVGYGLPIGGVIATRDAVIPYAVGVDIACRVKLTVLDLPVSTIEDDPDRLKTALARETRFGIGAKFKHRRQHEVMDANWDAAPVTQALKDRAWAQLGTSGSGNHFAEFGILTIDDDELPLARGEHLALLSHSGSRGSGATVASHYSKLAIKLHPELPQNLVRLAWLDLDNEEGEDYWQAMSLMGEYASANHAVIHREVAKHLGAEILLDLENHHNFAWKEVHDGEELVVHRKGATPAGEGVLGIIPGSMATSTYVVRGKGNSDSLHSAAHGAGRVMSRTQAKKTLSWEDARAVLAARKVTLMSAGLDEVPAVYKDIDSVMAAQSDLVEPLATFQPRIVRMARAGERPED